MIVQQCPLLLTFQELYIPILFGFLAKKKMENNRHLKVEIQGSCEHLRREKSNSIFTRVISVKAENGDSNHYLPRF